MDNEKITEAFRTILKQELVQLLHITEEDQAWGDIIHPQEEDDCSDYNYGECTTDDF